MAQRVHDRSLAAGDIVRSLLNDTVTDLSELRTWLRNMGDIASDRIAIASHVQEGDFDGAFALAQALPTLYGLEGEELADHSNHLRLLGLYRALHLSGRTTDQLTDDERLLVEDMARAAYPYSGSLARALLESTGPRGNNDYTCPKLPGTADKGSGSTGTEDHEAPDFKVTATPNPASSQVTVEYTLPEGSKRATLSIANILGMEMLTMEIDGSNGSKTIDTSAWPSGLYYLIVTDGNGRSYSEKIIKK